MRSEGLSFWKVMDLAVPCVVMGIVIGRIGDLIIADHLGKPTDFFLGYVCPAVETGSPCLADVGRAVHQPALYDLFSASLLLVTLMRVRRNIRYDGFLTCFFGAWYGTGRFLEDFFRVDDTHGTGLTGSQWTALTVTLLCLYVLLVKRDTPWHSGRDPAGETPLEGAAEGSGEIAAREPEEPQAEESEDVPGSMPAQPPATGDG
jgi:phosphatidylglycerol:prolipoprotein diacylglycerol transferase